MIRLVHQFDSMGTRPQVASPKSSACSCCCCCCVATTLTSGVLTARAVGRVPPKTLPMPDFTPAPTDGPLPDPGAPSPAADPAAPKRSVLGWKFLGFFMLPIAVVLSALVAQFTPNHMGVVVGSFLFLGTYIGGLLTLRHLVGLHGGWVLGLVIGLPFAIAAEVALWFALFFH